MAVSRVVLTAGLSALLGGCATTADRPAAPAKQSTAEPDSRSYEELLADLPASDWQEIAPEDLLVLEWAHAEGGDPQRVVIRLMDLDYGPEWAANVRALVRRGYWSEAAIYRVIPGFVAQWGVVPDPEATEQPAEPEYFEPVPPGSFTAPLSPAASPDQCRRASNALAGICDARAPQVRFLEGFVFGSDGDTMWPLFCKGMVGVARGMAPSQGSGGALYAVLSNDFRQMDRNLGVVGKVVEGFDLLDELPAASGPNGIYTAEERAPVFTRVALAADMTAEERPRYRSLKTDTASYDALLKWTARAHPFYTNRYDALSACGDIVPVKAIGE